MTKPRFSTVVGQKSAKNILDFLLENYEKTFYLQPTLISGQFGGGKTTLAIETAKYLKDKNNPNKIKKFISIHGVSLQTVDDFFNEIVIPHLGGQSCATIHVDEFHNVSSEVMEMFLTILETSKNTTTKYTYQGVEHEFDFTKISFLASSTDIQNIPLTLLSRFKSIELEDYTQNELGQMFVRGLQKYPVDKEVLEDFSKYTKDNPREIQNLAQNVRDYLNRTNQTKLDFYGWNKVKQGLSLKPMGLNNIELRILNSLKKYPNSSLTKLSALLSIEPATLRQRYELSLLRLNLMQIKPAMGRSLTKFGHDYLNQLEENA